MAVTLSDCFSTRVTNKLIIDCCCQMTCYLYNGYESSVRIIDLAYSAGDFPITGVFIDGNPISYPIDISPNSSVEFVFTICAPSTAQLGDFAIDIEVQGIGIDSYSYALEAVLPTDVISPTSLNFGNVAVGNGSFLYINISDELLCCNDFFINNLTAPFSDTGGVTVCPESGYQQIMVIFSPTELGTVTQDLTITINECNSLVVPLSGTGIEAPPPSTSPQKNKVDQTTRVEACSPRTVNNRCQTARTMQNAIKSTARRLGKR
jgi:hypothetical protein